MSGYIERLNASWCQHLAPRSIDAPTVISLFAGCGGSSLGYSMAGYRELLAIEWDQNAVDTFRLNFPDVPIYHGDIAGLSVDECLTMTGLQPGELDVLDGSPPCQGFSTAGKRNMNDSRNDLFREYVRLLRGLMPRAFVMENVSGMVKGKMKLIFAEILRELKASGYRVSARLMNAMYFDVPQSRQRMIFIGVRDDLDIAPSHPVAMTKPVTIREALPWVDSLQWDSQGNEGKRTFDVQREPMASVRVAGGGAQTRYAITARNGSQFQRSSVSLDRSSPTIREGDESSFEVSIERFAIGTEWANLKPGQTSDKYFNLVRPSLDSPSPTISKSGGGRETASVTHPTECRKFEIEEVKRLCSYPDRFEMTGSYSEQWSRLGNSVPPLFMRAIAAHIQTHILSVPVAMAAD